MNLNFEIQNIEILTYFKFNIELDNSMIKIFDKIATLAKIKNDLINDTKFNIEESRRRKCKKIIQNINEKITVSIEMLEIKVNNWTKFCNDKIELCNLNDEEKKITKIKFSKIFKKINIRFNYSKSLFKKIKFINNISKKFINSQIQKAINFAVIKNRNEIKEQLVVILKLKIKKELKIELKNELDSVKDYFILNVSNIKIKLKNLNNKIEFRFDTLDIDIKNNYLTLRTEIIKNKVKLDKMEVKLDKMEVKLDKMEVKLDNTIDLIICFFIFIVIFFF